MRLSALFRRQRREPRYMRRWREAMAAEGITREEQDWLLRNRRRLRWTDEEARSAYLDGSIWGV